MFRFTKFDTNNKDLTKIVKALNLKGKKRIIYVYDEAIKEINKYYSKDLCQFKDNQCIVQRTNGKGQVNGCCCLCSLKTEKGCPTVNLSCKLLYCKTALGNIKALKLNDIKILKVLSLRQRLILKGEFFSSKEEIINDLYHGIVYSAFRACFSEITRHKKRGS